MINKQKLWFVTLFTLIIVLSVYYVTMPTNLITNTDSVVITDEDVSKIDVLKDIKEEDYNEEIESIEDIILSPDNDAEIVNEAYDKLNSTKDNNNESIKLEEKLKTNLNIDACVVIEDNNIKVNTTGESSYSLANEIIRCIQEEYDTPKNIVVKFN